MYKRCHDDRNKNGYYWDHFQTRRILKRFAHNKRTTMKMDKNTARFIFQKTQQRQKKFKKYNWKWRQIIYRYYICIMVSRELKKKRLTF